MIERGTKLLPDTMIEGPTEPTVAWLGATESTEGAAASSGSGGVCVSPMLGSGVVGSFVDAGAASGVNDVRSWFDPHPAKASVVNTIERAKRTRDWRERIMM